MKKLIATQLLIIASLTAFSWGATGHRVTGWVADKHLSKKARKEIERILGGESLAIACTWMDEIRSDSLYNYAEDWHFVTIPNGTTYQATTKSTKGDLIEAIDRLIAALKSKKLSAQEETKYLKMLIHLIGDIHQPLHVGIPGDRGGNEVKVTWFRSDSNLHRVWDSDMIDDSKLSYTELGLSLEKPDAVKITSWQKSSTIDWATESISYRDQVYKYGNGKLGYKYTYDNFHLVRQRLLQAGIRMAGVLNAIYG